MSEILGFLISFGLIAAFISALTSGSLRNIAFAVLIIFAIVVGQERLGTQLSSFSFPFSLGGAPGTTSAPATASYGVGGPTYNTRPQNYGGTYPSRTNPEGSYTTSINPNPDSRRVYYPNDPYYNDPYYNDPYYNDPYYNGSYPGGFYPVPGSGQQTQTGRGVRALW